MNAGILILSSNTGGGHQSAANALQESFLRKTKGRLWVTISQALEEASIASRWMGQFYNYLLRNHQHAMKYYYRAIEHLKPYESSMILQWSLKYGMQLVEKVAPSALVSVHPMTQHFSAFVLKKLGLLDKVPLITVVTDPCQGFWQGWACDAVSQYFVASTEAKEQLIEFGVESSKIAVSGMPVHAKFKPIVTDSAKWALRQELGLHPDRFTVLMNTGWIGGGNLPALFDTLLRQAPDNIQLVFLAGRNEELFHQAVQASQQSQRFPVKVVGYTQTMETWMQASDVMISKMGGLTTFEALASHLPIIGDCLTEPMPQEEGTVRYIEQQGAGCMIESPKDAVDLLHRMITEPHFYKGLHDATKRLGRPGAVDTITDDIMNWLPAGV